MGVLGIIVLVAKSMWVSKQDAGEKNMQELAQYIADGAMAFLKAEWKVLSYFAVIAGIVLAYSGTLVPDSDPIIAIAFLIGAFFSSISRVYWDEHCDQSQCSNHPGRQVKFIQSS